MKSFPWVKQLDSMQCGAACLSMISLFYKGKMHSSEISNLCITGKSGISMAGIEDAARKIGFQTNCYMMSGNWFVASKLYRC